MSWTVQWTGKIWASTTQTQSDGRVFERIERAPGSRIIITKEDKVLLSREKRIEIKGKVDYRLPGGKVFDTYKEFSAYELSGGNMLQASQESITKEALEEVGVVVDPEKLVLLGCDVLGATCRWDLYYWVATEFELHQSGAQFNESEADEIIGWEWVPFDTAIKLALDPVEFSEGRSARMLLKYINDLSMK